MLQRGKVIELMEKCSISDNLYWSNRNCHAPGEPTPITPSAKASRLDIQVPYASVEIRQRPTGRGGGEGSARAFLSRMSSCAV